MASAVTVDHPALAGFEVQAEAEAGIYLGGERAGQRWWGTRVRYRQAPARRWESVTLVDIHPFDTAAISYALGALITGVAR